MAQVSPSLRARLKEPGPCLLRAVIGRPAWHTEWASWSLAALLTVPLDKPKLSDQSGPHPPPGAWPLPPLSAWGTVPLGPAPLTVPLDASQISLTQVGPILLLELGCSACLGHSTTQSHSAHNASQSSLTRVGLSSSWSPLCLPGVQCHLVPLCSLSHWTQARAL